MYLRQLPAERAQSKFLLTKERHYQHILLCAKFIEALLESSRRAYATGGQKAGNCVCIGMTRNRMRIDKARTRSQDFLCLN